MATAGQAQAERAAAILACSCIRLTQAVSRPALGARRVVSQCTAGLPDGKPRYVMGIGYPLDIVICSGGGPWMLLSLSHWAPCRSLGCCLSSGLVVRLPPGSEGSDCHAHSPACPMHLCTYLHQPCTICIHSAADWSSAGALATDPGARYDAATARGLAPPPSISAGRPEHWPPGLSAGGHSDIHHAIACLPDCTVARTRCFATLHCKQHVVDRLTVFTWTHQAACPASPPAYVSNSPRSRHVR